MTDNATHKSSIWSNTSAKDEFPMNLRPTQTICLLLCIFIICYILTTLAVFAVTRATAGNQVAGLRISAILQDVLLFVVPAVATAMISTRYPAQLLCLMQAPRVKLIVIIIAVLVVSIPAQDAVIYWNYHWSWLPPAVEQFARNLEEAAESTLSTFMADDSAISLIINIIIIGVAAGFSEELLFRGTILRLLMRSRLNTHVCIWLVAIIFSAMHFQFFGFVPRMLLGAYFGYLLVWTRSVWMPAIAHVLNNTVYVVAAWVQMRSSGMEAAGTEPTLWSFTATAASAVLTIGLLYLLRRSTTRSAD